MSFFIFHLEAQMICIGERIKKGNFRPCTGVIPQSTITGSLKDFTGLEDLYCLGYWDNPLASDVTDLPIKIITCSPHYVDRNSPRLPLFIEYLEKPQGKIFIEKNASIPEPEAILSRLANGTFSMGALKSKGFGTCKIKYLYETTKEDLEPTPGFLRTSLYDDPQNRMRFGIQKVIKPYWGYLFKPCPSREDGDYVISLFSGSEVIANRFLVTKKE